MGRARIQGEGGKKIERSINMVILLKCELCIFLPIRWLKSSPYKVPRWLKMPHRPQFEWNVQQTSCVAPTWTQSFHHHNNKWSCQKMVRRSMGALQISNCHLKMCLEVMKIFYYFYFNSIWECNSPCINICILLVHLNWRHNQTKGKWNKQSKWTHS